MSSSSIGARLDRLPITRLHRKVFGLVAVGMFFEGFDIYIAASVLGATYKSGFSTLAQNGLFISATFVGMTLGALMTGFWGDRYGRRVTYQANLMLFGGASLASSFAPDMTTLIALRFLMGLGLGAENVVGYSIMAEFFPARVRGRWSGLICTLVTAGLPASALLAWLLVPTFGWRVMFVLGAVGAFVAFALRRSLPESPRWLAAVGREAEADELVSRFERAAGAGPPPTAMSAPASVAPDASGLFRAPYIARLVVGCVSLMVVNTLIYGFITWLPTFFVGQGETIARSTGYALLMAVGGPIGSALGAISADFFGRKSTIVGAAATTILLSVIFSLSSNALLTAALGFLLTIPIYVLVAVLFAVYVPELFPTEFRLRGVGICNAAGRSASIIVPLFVAPIFGSYGVGGVLAMMGAALLAMIIVVASLGEEPEREPAEEAIVAT
ncbi:MFS transporter [Bradyrhizobium sacchari]|uniref:Putative MFS transporter n=1 Tax=Bradyrhizobium sacchari TaxID=1399419 RepID=A0A560JTQ0_9BRAD|nr:MFS transporter [Bradyrhizobium sacchari]OPY97021.1 MFS transporter [Bradyrhizobium sacchari]TWB58766.1 putative MFS transporter [Bradyrhizobium sacchari]TWB72874.1 putative MFS transporter [Bradyrhizobium sacchari]